MTGEMHKSEVTRDAYPAHFAIAAELGGTVEPFDQYQGPYIQLDGARLWIACEDGIGGYVWNETTRCKSEEFFIADMEHTEEAVAAAREVYPSGGVSVDAPKPPTVSEMLQRLAVYVSPEDSELSPEQFRRVVADRIQEDKKP